MLRMLRVMCVCLLTLPALCEPPKYEVATIMDVKLHQPAADNASEVARKYDVSVRVADTIYLTLYTDVVGTGTIKYAAGRELLVHVGKDTITYNDILGRSQEVPIISRTPATNTKQPK
jgi:hypothetical protein